MLDDDKARRQDAGPVHGQELLVTMRAHRPAVPVVVKRRRVVQPHSPEDEALAHDTVPAAERAPRVFRVEGGPPPTAALPEPFPVPVPGPRRRDTADPVRRPGEVTRIVFERPEPEAEPAPPSFVPAGYAEVQASLERVRAELDRARLARRLRF